MTKAFIQKGEILSFTAPYQVGSGDGFLVTSFFAVANTSAANGASVEGMVTGCHRLTALSTDTGSVGTKVYWDNTNKRVTVTSTNNSPIGALIEAKTAGQTTAAVRLNGVAI